MKKSGSRIGLVLPGGGARGSYQIGVMLALKKYGLLKNVKALSGGSIGAFSMIGFLMNDLKKAYYTFKEMNSERVLGYKKSLKDKIPLNGKGLFSRAPLVSFLNKHFDLGAYVDTDLPLYVSLARMEKKLVRAEYKAEYFKLNHLNHDRVVSILLATSAIPRVFDKVRIAGNYYVDCLKADNEPLTPLLSHDIDALFVIPLTSSHSIRKYSQVDIPVVDFESLELRNSPLLNMLDFESEKVDMYLNCGYFNGLALLRTLYEKGYIKKGELNLPKYNYISQKDIRIIPYKLLSIEEIIMDVERGIR